jgi:NADPH-dependent F420 reductase
MRIALLGGTGNIGEGLVMRWAYDTDHELVVGSRETTRAREAAAEYETELDSRGLDRTVEAATNEAAVVDADVVVVGVPPYHVSDTVEAVGDNVAEDSILLSPAVGMKRDDAGMHYHRPGAGSVTAVAAAAAPEGVPTVGAFHPLAADRLADLDAELGQDVPVVGDETAAKETVMALTEEISGLRAVDAGPLANAAEVESLTPLVINVARYNEGMHRLGIRFE